MAVVETHHAVSSADSNRIAVRAECRGVYRSAERDLGQELYLLGVVLGGKFFGVAIEWTLKRLLERIIHAAVVVGVIKVNRAGAVVAAAGDYAFSVRREIE